VQSTKSWLPTWPGITGMAWRDGKSRHEWKPRRRGKTRRDTIPRHRGSARHNGIDRVRRMACATRFCGMNASHRTTHRIFCIDATRRRCFLLTCACETMNSGFGMRESDSHNASSLSAHASTNGRTVHGPQPCPGEAEAIRCRSIRLDRARNGEDRGACTLHRAGSQRVGTVAALVCAGTCAVPRSISRMATMRD
jgi:hypothetical protein